MSILIKNGRIVTAVDDYMADVFIEGEKISLIGKDLKVQADKVIDASNRLVLPGGIDPHTHFDMPFGGTTSADDFASGTKAAAFGGTTTIIDFAIQSKGESTLKGLDAWHDKASGKATIDYGFHMIITDMPDERLPEMRRLVDEGITSYKLFMAYPGVLYVDDGTLYRTFRQAGDNGTRICMHAENGIVIDEIIKAAVKDGKTSPKYHALTRPEEVEAEATGRAIRLAEIADTPLVVVHVTCDGALEEIKRAHARGRPVYGETCPQYLVFSYGEHLDQPGFEGAKYVCSPPLRDPRNQPILWRGLQSQDLQIVGSDHCAFNYAGQKELGRDDFTAIPNGAPGAEERAAVMWTHGVSQGRISENLMVAVLSTNQARIHGMAGRKGALIPGADADIVVWDPDLEITATQSNRHGNVDYTPYEGMTFRGAPASVYVRGNLAYADGEVLAPAGSGRFVHRSFRQPAPAAAVR
jgi:dihydropyrimidinase